MNASNFYVKKIYLILFILFSLSYELFGIKYNGKTLIENTEFTRSTLAVIEKKSTSEPEEISGMACSRTTKGYYWVNSDNGNNAIYALGPDGKTKFTVILSNVSMRDWEDICIATVEGKNYILVGAFGDNDLAYKDDYYIYRFEEPVVKEGSSKSVTVEIIRFGYPNGSAFNAETIMYDPVGNQIYIVNKIKDEINTIFSLPYKASYSGKQTLTKVQDLGKKGEKFNFLTAGDISADGTHILIKNKTDVLYWKRKGSEDLSITFARDPEHIKAYSEETQGEAIAWNHDASAFYTCSDVKTKDDTNPIYKYTCTVSTTGIQQPNNDFLNLFIENGMLTIENKEKQPISICNLTGQKIIIDKKSPVDVSSLHGIYIIRIGGFSKKMNFK